MLGLDETTITKAWLQPRDVDLKLSRADFAFALFSGRTGATTVAATICWPLKTGRHFSVFRHWPGIRRAFTRPQNSA